MKLNEPNDDNKKPILKKKRPISAYAKLPQRDNKKEELGPSLSDRPAAPNRMRPPSGKQRKVKMESTIPKTEWTGRDLQVVMSAQNLS